MKKSALRRHGRELLERVAPMRGIHQRDRDKALLSRVGQAWHVPSVPRNDCRSQNLPATRSLILARGGIS